jgi:hypothetical protein
VLAPFIVSSEPEHRFVHVRYGDGSADVYPNDDDMMANHISGTSPWKVLVEGAKAAGWVILPVGCPTCLTDEAQRSHLPEGTDEDVLRRGRPWRSGRCPRRNSSPAANDRSAPCNSPASSSE